MSRWFGWGLITTLALLTAFAPWLSGVSFNDQNSQLILLSPSGQHFFGTDSLGRDLFTRVFVGARISLAIAAGASLLSMFIGTFVGTAAGWLGGRGDRWVLRSVDVMQSIPSFLLVSLVCLFLQNAMTTVDFQTRNAISLGLAIALVHWFNIAKVTRTLTLKTKSLTYIDAAKALGASPFHIVTKHILPNMHGTLRVLLIVQIPSAILYESMISFAGYGLQSPQISWGLLLQEGWRSLAEFPHLLLLPAGVLFLTVLAFHLVVKVRP